MLSFIKRRSNIKLSKEHWTLVVEIIYIYQIRIITLLCLFKIHILQKRYDKINSSVKPSVLFEPYFFKSTNNSLQKYVLPWCGCKRTDTLINYITNSLSIQVNSHNVILRWLMICYLSRLAVNVNLSLYQLDKLITPFWFTSGHIYVSFRKCLAGVSYTIEKYL